MIPKSFGLLFYLKKPGCYAKGEHPIHLLITIDAISKEMSIQRSWNPARWNSDQVKALIGKKYSKGMLTKFATALKHTRSFLQWKYKVDDIDIRQYHHEIYCLCEENGDPGTPEWLAAARPIHGFQYGVARGRTGGADRGRVTNNNRKGICYRPIGPNTRYFSVQLLLRAGLCRSPKVAAIGDQHGHRRE